MFAAQAKAVLRRDGGGIMEIGARDMGQGAWTVLAQINDDVEVGHGVGCRNLLERGGSMVADRGKGVWYSADRLLDLSKDLGGGAGDGFEPESSETGHRDTPSFG
jgi:hypothetical protein